MSIRPSKRLVSKPLAFSEVKKHLPSVLVRNGYPSSFVRKLTRKRKATPKRKPVTEFKSTAVLPYVKEVQETLRCCLQPQGNRAVLKSDTRLRSK